MAQHMLPGLVAFGFLKIKLSLLNNDFMISGTILLIFISPPPITFPARALTVER